MKLLHFLGERRGEYRNAWVVKWPRCHDDGRRLIGAVCGLQHERLRVLLHTHNPCVRLDGKRKVVGIGVEIVCQLVFRGTTFRNAWKSQAGQRAVAPRRE